MKTLARHTDTTARTLSRSGTMLLEMEERASVPQMAAQDHPSVTRPSGQAAARGGCDGALCSQARAEAGEPVLPEAQRRWAAKALSDRLQVLRTARHWIAEHPEALSKALSPRLARNESDTLVSEVLPLLDAIRFLERSAPKILATRNLGRRGRPLWLTGVQTIISREPLGHLLVLGPANFPLFLPGVQVVQALAAGNAVTWKPGSGGRRVALLMHRLLREAGLPRGVLHITDETAVAGREALRSHPDKVFLTGSLATGQQVLSDLAEKITPATMELSGADAVAVLPSADIALAAKAIAFGLRLNGGEVCMSPRRLVATADTLQRLRPLLLEELAQVPPVSLRPETAERLHDLLGDALARGAELLGSFTPTGQRPLLIDNATPAMTVTQSDIFAPVLSILRVPSALHMADVINQSPMGLTAAVFGEHREAAALGAQLRVGTVLVNDLIAPTADPRTPFGGRGRSGFGVTRGKEGLLEMTRPKVVLSRRKGLTRHYTPLGKQDLPFFTGVIGLLHGGTLKQRWRALQRAMKAARGRSAS